VYPRYSETHRVSGTLLVQFVVDTSGRADMSTFHDLWPSNKPRLTGELGDYYAQFVAAVRDYAEKAKFTPARVGACKLRQMVQMPIEFVQPKRPGAYSKSQ
jgi:protein TonB